jgi:hypothetical protein
MADRLETRTSFSLRTTFTATVAYGSSCFLHGGNLRGDTPHSHMAQVDTSTHLVYGYHIRLSCGLQLYSEMGTVSMVSARQ